MNVFSGNMDTRGLRQTLLVIDCLTLFLSSVKYQILKMLMDSSKGLVSSTLVPVKHHILSNSKALPQFSSGRVIRFLKWLISYNNAPWFYSRSLFFSHRTSVETWKFQVTSGLSMFRHFWWLSITLTSYHTGLGIHCIRHLCPNWQPRLQFRSLASMYSPMGTLACLFLNHRETETKDSLH